MGQKWLSLKKWRNGLGEMGEVTVPKFGDVAVPKYAKLK
jgi:hypothetical protein